MAEIKDATMNVSVGKLSLPGEPPDELPGGLYELVAFVPFSEKRRDADMTGRTGAVTDDDWVWVREVHRTKGLLTADEVPEALVKFSEQFKDADQYGKPHFRLIEMTDEGADVAPVVGIAFKEDDTETAAALA